MNDRSEKFPTLAMTATSLVPLKDQKEKPSLLIEVANVEKQLWALIHAKGLLHSGVQDLYRTVCSSYEKIILNDHQLAELQDVEYSLWKLHYRHIHEFRERIGKNLNNDEPIKIEKPQTVGSQRSNDNHTEGFKLFLSEAAEFYQNLISKIRSCNGLPEDFFLYKKSSCNSGSLETKKIQKMQFLCHRFLVCLGDLARYREQCENSDIQSHNWTAAVRNYLEATLIWPESGNPQNQLAVLATYVGDEFLALYHCIRSFAVKEPFPDAWNNLILLFERNRLSPLHSLSTEAFFDFSRPSESCMQTKAQSTDDSSSGKIAKEEHEGLRGANLWPLVIRMISFFFIKSSLDELPFTFASAMRELDTLMVLDDVKLKASMESYQKMDTVRTGPFRPLQIVSIFAFVIENLISSPKVKNSGNKSDSQELMLIEMALTITFIFMGRLVDRCLKSNWLDSCPLLPALLVFVEWLASISDEIEAYGSNEKSVRAISYFFGTFVELLKQFDIKRGEEPTGSIALWEDYELRGFAPLARVHLSLEFSTYRRYADSFKSGNDCRMCRIFNAAMRIADRSNNNWGWILYDKSGSKFYVADLNQISNRKESEKGESTAIFVDRDHHQHITKATEEHLKVALGEIPCNPRVLHKAAAVEDEEVILFKPLTRFNSAPIHGYITSKDQISPRDTVEQTVPADECLRRATSLLIAQNQADGDPLTFVSDLTNFRCQKPSKQQEPVLSDTVAHPFSEASAPPAPPPFITSISAGPPSLNAWVLNRGLGNDRMKGKIDNKNSLTPIEEIASASLNDLSISESDDLVISPGHGPVTSHYASPVSLAPVPSAPFLPDDSVWFNGIQSACPDYNGLASSNKTNDLFPASQVGGYSNWTGSHQPLDYGPGIQGFMDEYPPPRRMTSSEWLRQYRESQNFERAANHVWPVPSYASGNAGTFYGQDITRSGLFDQWGTPLASNPLYYTESPSLLPGFLPVYGMDEHRKEKPFQGYQRPNPHGCGAVNEPEPLLHYLKEKEWRLQQDPSLGPAYMGR